MSAFSNWYASEFLSEHSGGLAVSIAGVEYGGKFF
jgi:hypothetical protein